MTPRVSIVIPTHNRRAVLARTIAALREQQYPLERIEVIVVADGCTDDTEHIEIAPRLSGRVIAHPRRGPAAARNCGAAAATGDLLLFMDDDVEAWPGLVDAHVRAHAAQQAPALVVGYLPPRLETRRDPFGVALRGWWHAMFERLREPGYRFTYADALTGNCSIPRSLLDAVGGFDDSLRCHEDYELGYRVLRAGGRIQFAPDAGGWHHDRTTLAGALKRKRQEGSADIAIARKHPEILPTLPLSDVRVPPRRQRVLRTLALQASLVGDLVALGGQLTLAVLAAARARRRWRLLLQDLLLYWYWRGVGDALGTTPIDAFRAGMSARLAPAPELPEIDLRRGLSAAASVVDRIAPPGIVLRYGNVYVGTISAKPWAEPLQGRHLRHLLKTRLSNPLSNAIAVTNAIESTASTPFEAIRVLVSTPLATVDDERA